jgi:hypothetical protein
MHNDWQNALWKILTNPAVDMAVAIVAVMVAAWFVIDTDMFHRSAPMAVPRF